LNRKKGEEARCDGGRQEKNRRGIGDLGLCESSVVNRRI